MAIAPNIAPELKPYAVLVEFLGEILGDGCEVLLHDCSDFNESIVAVANSHISGRSLGGPATDLVLRIWKSKRYEHTDYYTNYTSYSSDGRAFRSSTFFVRNTSGQVIALLCINQDDGPIIEAQQLLKKYLSGFRLSNDTESQRPKATNLTDREVDFASSKSRIQSDGDMDSSVDELSNKGVSYSSAERLQENLSISVDEITTNRIKALAIKNRIDPARLSKEERIDFIRQLDDEGIFLLKGAIEKTAEALNLSKPSVYRYLKEARHTQRQYQHTN